MEQVLGALKAAAEITRLRLLALLRHGELTVTELTQILGQSQPRVSRHLKLMCEAGLVDRFQEGTWAFYRLAEHDRGSGPVSGLVALIPDESETLARDLARLDLVKAARAEVAADYFRANAQNWDRIRSLHVPESEVEEAILDIVGDGEIGDLLDVGTGTGRMLELFGPRMRRGIGIDLSREMLAIARAQLDRHGLANAQVRLGDMYNLGLPNAAADVILFHQVLHYADDPGAAVSEAARVLRPGGRVVIVDFAPHDLEFLRTENAHRRLGFSDQEVVRWCKRAGLSAKTVRHLGGTDLTVTIWLAHKADAVPSIAGDTQ